VQVVQDAVGPDAVDAESVAGQPETGCLASTGAGRRETRDVRLPGFDAPMRENQGGTVLGPGGSRSRNGCGRSFERSTSNSNALGINPSPCKGNGYEASWQATSPTSPCPVTPMRSQPSAPRSGAPGSRRCGAAANAPDSTGRGWTASRNDGYHPPDRGTRFPSCALTPEPKAGAQCGNPARWDLCGGPPETAVPTANPAGWGGSGRCRQSRWR
jgi:hypothetical protein